MVLGHAPVHAQERAPLFSDLRVELSEGLHTAGGVHGIVRGADGFLWVATELGLFRYDGREWAEYGQPEGMASLSTLAVDSEGTLWIGSLGFGLGFLRSGVSARTGDAADATINTMAADPVAGVWAGSEGGALIRAWRDSTATFELRDDLAGVAVSAVYPSAGGPWVGTRGRGLLRFDGTTFRRAEGTESISASEILALVETRDGTLWIGGRTGLHTLAEGHLTARAGSGAPRQPITALLEDSFGSVWVGTAGGGLFRFGPDGWEDLSGSKGMAPADIRSLALDEDGSVWAGTRVSGLLRLREPRVKGLGPAQGLPVPVALPVLAAPDGDVWVGTFGGGLARFQDGNATVLNEEDGLDDPFVLALARDSTGGLWMGTRTSVYRVTDRRPQKVLPRPGAPALGVLALHADPAGVVWLGTTTGLARWDGSSLTTVLTTDGGSTGPINTFLSGRDGTLWIGTAGRGVFAMDPERDAVEQRFRDTLPSPVILAMHEDSEGFLWFGTTQGVLLQRGELSDTLDAEDGLPDPTVLRILEPDGGFLWFSSNRGVFRVARQQILAVADGALDQVESVLFTDADGMPSAEANGGLHPAGDQTADGHLWFPTVAGVAVFDPTFAVDDVLDFAPVLDAVEVDGEAIWVAGATSAPPDAVGPRVSRLTLRYATPYPASPQSLVLQYRSILDGNAGAWEGDPGEHIASYTGLRPGSYSFELRARLLGGTWGDPVEILQLTVRPALTQTAWFKVAALLVAAALLVILDRWRGRFRHAREARLQTLVAQQSRELQALASIFEQAVRGTSPEGLTEAALSIMGGMLEAGAGIAILPGADPAAPEVFRWRPDDSQGTSPGIDEEGLVALDGWARTGDVEVPTVEREGPSIRGILRHEYGGLVAFGFVRDRERPFSEIDEQHLTSVMAALAESHGRILAEDLREAASRELQQTNTDLDAFAGLVSHDLRTPLTAVEGLIEAVRDPDLGPLSEIQARFLGQMDSQVHSMQAMIEGLLAFSRVGRAQLLRQPVDVSGLAEEVRDTLQSAHGHELAMRIEPGMTCDGDPVLLRQALQNLVGNAVKFSATAPSPLVEMGTEMVAGERTFFIKDNGVGFPAGQADQLFKPFVRLAGSESFEGTGLGLSLARRVVKRHGGRIWAESPPEGGASFYFTIPPVDQNQPSRSG